MRLHSICCLVFLACGYHSLTHAAFSATAQAVQPSAWVKLADKTRVLKPGDTIGHGNVIVTDESGRVEINIDDALLLQQNTNSELTLTQVAEDPASSQQTEINLLVQAGKSCLQFRSTSLLRKVVVDLGSTMKITIYDSGAVCVLHQDGLSSVHLREGSIQINHSVDSNIIVLSEPGSEFQVEFGESYSVLLPEMGEVYRLASEGFPLPPAAAVIETVTVSEQVEQTASQAATATSSTPEPEAAAAEPASSAQTAQPEVKTTAAPAAPEVMPSYDAGSKYVYTVYLFSTRDLEIANAANQRFRNAGYPSEIYSTESAETSRHRVVVTGFSSREAAQMFADKIVGKHGIADTWIGRDRRRAPE